MPPVRKVDTSSRVAGPKPLTTPMRSTQGGGDTKPSYLENRASGRPSFTPPQEVDGDNRDPGAEREAQGAGGQPNEGLGMPTYRPPVGPPPTPVAPPPVSPPGGGVDDQFNKTPVQEPVAVPPPVAPSTPLPPITPAPSGDAPPGAAPPGREEENTPAPREDDVNKVPLNPTPGGLPTSENPAGTPPITPAPAEPEPEIPQENPNGGLPETQPPKSDFMSKLGKLIEDALSKPSRYDSEQAKKFYEHGKADLTRERDMSLADLDTRAAERGVFHSSIPITGSEATGIGERYGRGLADFATNIAREQATTESEDRSRAVKDAFEMMNQARSDDTFQLAVAQLVGALGNQGELDLSGLFGDTITPDFGGGIDWDAIGAMFSGGNKKKKEGSTSSTTTNDNKKEY